MLQVRGPKGAVHRQVTNSNGASKGKAQAKPTGTEGSPYRRQFRADPPKPDPEGQRADRRTASPAGSVASGEDTL